MGIMTVCAGALSRFGKRVPAKALASAALAVAVALTGSLSFAEITDFDGGISGNLLLKANTYEYSEVTFISGEPVILTGTVTIPVANKTLAKYTMAYTYDLSNDTKQVTLARKVTYQVENAKDSELSQTTTKYTLSKLDEKYTVGGKAYNLGRFVFQKSALTDNTPAVDYLSGSLYSERVFYIGGDYKKNSGSVSITSTSDSNVGYRHVWGQSESMVVRQRYEFTNSTGTASGTADIRLSSTDKEAFKFVKTGPQNISFRGNYVETDTRETVLSYSYDMPSVSGGTFNDRARVMNTKSLKKSVVTNTKSLIAPKARDIYGVSGETSMLFALSLKLFDDGSYFSPNVNVTKMDFAKALARSIADVKPLTQSDLVKRARPGYVPVIKYTDIDQQNPNISYLELLQSKGIINGEGQYFYPEKPITRAEAVSMIVRSLGLQTLAPAPPYRTAYYDDSKIPYWAKDCVYAAYEIGLERGLKDGTFRPLSTVTRAEASILLTNMINHIKDKITPDYREKMLNR